MNTVSPRWVEYTPSGEDAPHLRFGVDNLDGAIVALSSAHKRDPQISDVAIYEGGGLQIGAGFRHYGPSGAYLEGEQTR